jgi:hypothetical protein
LVQFAVDALEQRAFCDPDFFGADSFHTT